MQHRIDFAAASKQMGQLLDQVHDLGDTIIIERDGRPMAALVSEDLLEAQASALRRLQEIAEIHQKKNAGLSDEIEAVVMEEVRQLRKK